jgi:hypothetical protein
MPAFDDFRTAVLDGAEGLARNLLHGSVADARADAEAFLRKSAAKFQDWSQQVAEGKLTQDEFAFLVRSERDLAELNGLTRAGIAATKVDQFRGELVNLAVTKAIDILL